VSGDPGFLTHHRIPDNTAYPVFSEAVQTALFIRYGSNLKDKRDFSGG